MGLFSAKDNYTLIATNVGLIYGALCRTDYSKSLSQDEKLFAAAVFDTTVYVAGGKISLDELRQAVMLARIGACSLDFYHVQHENMIFFSDETTMLVNLAMQLLCLIFRVDLEMNHRYIVNIVIQKKESMRKALKKALSGKYDAYIESFVQKSCKDDDFRKVIESYKENEETQHQQTSVVEDVPKYETPCIDPEPDHISADNAAVVPDIEIMHCKHCGRAIDPDSSFCRHCGGPQTTPASDPPARQRRAARHQ